MIIEFENVFESDLVAALHKALYFAKANDQSLVPRLEALLAEAERHEEDQTSLQ